MVNEETMNRIAHSDHYSWNDTHQIILCRFTFALRVSNPFYFSIFGKDVKVSSTFLRRCATEAKTQRAVSKLWMEYISLTIFIVYHLFDDQHFVLFFRKQSFDFSRKIEEWIYTLVHLLQSTEWFSEIFPLFCLHCFEKFESLFHNLRTSITFFVNIRSSVFD